MFHGFYLVGIVVLASCVFILRGRVNELATILAEKNDMLVIAAEETLDLECEVKALQDERATLQRQLRDASFEDSPADDSDFDDYNGDSEESYIARRDYYDIFDSDLMHDEG